MQDASMTGIFTLLGHQFSFVTLWLIPLTFTVVALGLGFGLILGVMNVFLRDIGQAVPIILQMWFWFTPIIYPENIIPESYRHLLNINPLFPIVSAYHDVLVYNKVPQLEQLAIISVFSLLLMLLSLFLFRRANAEMVDVL